MEERSLFPQSCARCFERDLECDGTEPFCGRCSQDGLSCPGYSLRRASGQGSGRSLSPALRSRRARTGTPTHRVRASDDHPGPSRAARASSLTSSLLQPPSIPRPSPAVEENITDQFASFLNHHPLARYLQLSWFDTFLHDVPQLLGDCPVLDEAAACLATTDVALPRTAAVSAQSSSHYVRALGLLQTALADEEESESPKVLCATALLQAYELCATPDHTFWIQHAGGASRLIQSRGPDAHRDGISRAILESLRGNIVVNCIASRRHCFLAESSWVNVVSEDRSFFTDPEDARRERFLLRRHQFNLLLAYLPGVLEDTARLIKYTASDASTSFPFGCERDFCIALIFRILALRRSLTSWRLTYFGTLGYVDIASLGLQASSSTATLEPASRRGPIYSDYVSASLDCVANCTIIVANCLLSNLIPLLEFLPKTQEDDPQLADQLPALDDIVSESGQCADIARRSYTFVKAHSPANAKWIAHGFAQAWYAAYEYCSEETREIWTHLNELWDGFGS